MRTRFFIVIASRDCGVATQAPAAMERPNVDTAHCTDRKAKQAVPDATADDLAGPIAGMAYNAPVGREPAAPPGVLGDIRRHAKGPFIGFVAGSEYLQYNAGITGACTARTCTRVRFESTAKMQYDLRKLGLALLIVPLSSAGAFASEVSFRSIASPLSQTISSTGPSIITLDMTNSEKRDSDLYSVNGARTNAELDYFVRIHDQYGHEPNLTAHGQFIYHPTLPPIRSMQRHSIKPGQKVTESLDVTELYVLNPHSTYRISFEFRLAVHGVTTPIRSNWVTVTVK